MTEEQNINKNNTDNINENTDDSLAVKFPSWDLLPPDLLVKRGKNENA